MKMLFMQGKFKEDIDINRIDGTKSLSFEPITVTEGIEFFDESQYKMTGSLSLCDSFYFGNIENNDIFCIYYKKTITEDLAREAIKEVVVDGDVKNIVNNEDVFINEAVRHINYSQSASHEFYCDSTIFWDVINNMIIVFGRDNCLKMAYVLETEAYRRSGISNKVNNYVTGDRIHGFTKKVKAFTHND